MLQITNIWIKKGFQNFQWHHSATHALGKLKGWSHQWLDLWKVEIFWSPQDVQILKIHVDFGILECSLICWSMWEHETVHQVYHTWYCVEVPSRVNMPIVGFNTFEFNTPNKPVNITPNKFIHHQRILSHAGSFRLVQRLVDVFVTYPFEHELRTGFPGTVDIEKT